MQSPESVSHSSSNAHAHKSSVALLILGAIGVVFGDIGTSPLYAFREALHQAAATGIGKAEIIASSAWPCGRSSLLSQSNMSCS